MDRTNSKEKVKKKVKLEDKEKDVKVKLVRPGDPRVPCFAILGCGNSELKLVKLEGGSSSSVKISDHESRGIFTINDEVFAVTGKEILKLRSDGTTEHLGLFPLPGPYGYSQVVLFQKKIYIIHPYESMLCFDPDDNSLIDDLPGCGLGLGYCASATDDFICAMGGLGTETRALKYDPLRITWEETEPMRKERWHAAAATLDGKIYVMGGYGNGTSVEYYNPGNNSWTEISNMNARRKYFSACVVGDRLYAVGGDGEEKNGFYQHSIEVYDKNKWTVVTKFQTEDLWTYSCFWPHGSHQPGQLGAETDSKLPTTSKEIGDEARSAMIVMASDDGTEDETRGATAGQIPDNELQQLQYRAFGADQDNLSLDECSLTSPSRFTSESAEKTFLQSENLQETKKNIESSDRTECEISLPERVLKKETDVASKMTVSGKQKESKEVMLSEASRSRTFTPDEDYLRKSKLGDETDSKPTTSKEIDDESESSMNAVKSDDGTEAETGAVDRKEETIPETSKEYNDDESESAPKIAVERDDGTEAETTGATAGHTSDNELQQLEFQYIPPSTDKEIGPEGDDLSVDESSLTIRPKTLVDTQNLSITMLVNFQNLDLPADRIPVSPYLDIKFCGKLRIPAKARVPTWFRPLEDSEHGIKIYKRYRNEENKVAWRELQNEVTVHDKMIEFEIDHFCGFIAMIKDLSYWVRGEIRLSHGLLHRGENFLSAICYQSPESLFQQMIADLEKKGYKEIYNNRFVMKCTLEIPIKMECLDPPLHKFKPRHYVLTSSDIRANEKFKFPFLLQQLDEPKDAVEIEYIVNDFIAPFKVQLLDVKESELKKDLLKLEVRLEMAEKREAEARQEIALLQTQKPKIKDEEENLKKESKAVRKGANENKDVTSAVTFNLRDGATLSINSLHAGDKGDISTVTNQGTGNNFIAGSQDNTDRSVTAGKAIYGQSTSSSVGENITVNRSGK